MHWPDVLLSAPATATLWPPVSDGRHPQARVKTD